jgi:hypothetical protein
MLSVLMLSMLSVIILSVVMLNVVAPKTNICILCQARDLSERKLQHRYRR